MNYFYKVKRARILGPRSFYPHKRFQATLEPESYADPACHFPMDARGKIERGPDLGEDVDRCVVEDVRDADRDADADVVAFAVVAVPKQGADAEVERQSA